MNKKKYTWEVPEVNLNLRNSKYKGKASDAIKQLKDDIVFYLRGEKLKVNVFKFISFFGGALYL